MPGSVSLGGVLPVRDHVPTEAAADEGSIGAPVPLHLPNAWTSDRGRCRAAGVPGNVELATKPVLVRRVVERALAAGVPLGQVPADGVYGGAGRFRLRLESRDLARHPHHLPFGRPARGNPAGHAGRRAASDRGPQHTVPSCRPGPAPPPRRMSAAQVTADPARQPHHPPFSRPARGNPAGHAGQRAASAQGPSTRCRRAGRDRAPHLGE
ncbi:transposase [Streptomyces olivaceoviridis]|uniref:transposase n=1 Tax=Streptomyces olivaceoviridis TaxID=1921 RepID=UPI0036F77047